MRTPGAQDLLSRSERHPPGPWTERKGMSLQAQAEGAMAVAGARGHRAENAARKGRLIDQGRHADPVSPKCQIVTVEQRRRLSGNACHGQHLAQKRAAAAGRGAQDVSAHGALPSGIRNRSSSPCPKAGGRAWRDTRVPPDFSVTRMDAVLPGPVVTSTAVSPRAGLRAASRALLPWPTPRSGARERGHSRYGPTRWAAGR